MTNIALFIDGCDPQLDTLEAFLDVSGFTPIQSRMAKHSMDMGVPANFTSGGQADVLMVSLDHRDAPYNAAGQLDLDQMSELLKVFCKLHGLPFMSADEVLAEYYATTHCELVHFGIVNWLATYIDAWDDPSICETSHVEFKVFSPLCGVVSVPANNQISEV